ncbi:hypothetical protein [Xanthomonas vesicatoria]|uniref:hypothetical protein n=1 Tax=Xanthomonas vesicatoria TaxID=56460 RepID=UPI001E31F42B|nr:hypothetical protein [Xanthomonas vesicatoria]MCC8616637.1 hypothetical protein [Xanthomonas vesicatoria]MCC8630594.1 hypothetical protein [Xanthomonas vesicatoria]
MRYQKLLKLLAGLAGVLVSCIGFLVIAATSLAPSFPIRTTHRLATLKVSCLVATVTLLPSGRKALTPDGLAAKGCPALPMILFCAMALAVEVGFRGLLSDAASRNLQIIKFTKGTYGYFS